MESTKIDFNKKREEENVRRMKIKYVLNKGEVREKMSYNTLEDWLSVLCSIYNCEDSAEVQIYIYKAGLDSVSIYNDIEEIAEEISKGVNISGIVQTICEGYIYVDEYGYFGYGHKHGSRDLCYEYFRNTKDMKNLIKYNYLCIRAVICHMNNEIESLEGCPDSVVELIGYFSLLKTLEFCPPNLKLLHFDRNILKNETDILLLPTSVEKLFCYSPLLGENDDYFDIRYVTKEKYKYYNNSRNFKLVDGFLVSNDNEHLIGHIEEIHENNAVRLRGMKTKSARK